MNGTEAQASSSLMLGDGLPTLLAAWMGTLGLELPQTRFTEGVESPVLVDIEFSGSCDSPGGHNPLGMSSRRMGLCLILSPCCFLRFNCPTLSWLPGACAELVPSYASPTARQVLLWLSPLPGREGRQVVAPGLPRVTGLLLPLSRAVCCCQDRPKQTSLSPVLFPCASSWCLSGEQEQP